LRKFLRENSIAHPPTASYHKPTGLHPKIAQTINPPCNQSQCAVPSTEHLSNVEPRTPSSGEQRHERVQGRATARADENARPYTQISFWESTMFFSRGFRSSRRCRGRILRCSSIVVTCRICSATTPRISSLSAQVSPHPARLGSRYRAGMLHPRSRQAISPGTSGGDA